MVSVVLNRICNNNFHNESVHEKRVLKALLCSVRYTVRTRVIALAWLYSSPTSSLKLRSWGAVLRGTRRTWRFCSEGWATRWSSSGTSQARYCGVKTVQKVDDEAIQKQTISSPCDWFFCILLHSVEIRAWNELTGGQEVGRVWHRKWEGFDTGSGRWSCKSEKCVWRIPQGV